MNMCSGVSVSELSFPDGSPPNPDIIDKWLSLVHKEFTGTVHSFNVLFFYIYSPFYSFILSFIYSSCNYFIYSFIHSIIHFVIQLIHSFNDLFIHLTNYSFIQ